MSGRRSNSSAPMDVSEMKQAISDIEKGRVVAQKSSSHAMSIKSRSSSSAASVSPLFDSKTKKLKLPPPQRTLRITMGELKNKNPQEYTRIKPDFNDDEQMAHLEWQGIEELSEEAFDKYLYAPDVEEDDNPPEYEDDYGSVGHPAFITLNELANDEEKKYVPLPAVGSVSADVADAIRNKIKRKLKEISKVKLVSITEGDQLKINKEALVKAAELQQIYVLLKESPLRKSIWDAHGNKDECEQLLQETEKIREKLFTYPCRVAKQHISLYQKRNIYTQLYADVYNIISEDLEDNIHNLFNNYSSRTYDSVFHFALSDDEKKQMIRYSVTQRLLQQQLPQLNEDDLNREVERIYSEYNSKAVPGGGGQMPYKYIYFQENIQPNLKDATKLLTLNRMTTNKVTPALINDFGEIYKNRLYKIFTPTNPNIPYISETTRHTFFHNLPNKVQSKLLQTLDYFQKIQKCFQNFEKGLTDVGFMLPSFNYDIREEGYLQIMIDAWNMVPADKYSFDITSYPSYIVSLENMYKDIFDILKGKHTYRDWTNQQIAKNIADYEKDEQLYDVITNACDKMKLHIIITGVNQKTQEIQKILKYIKHIQKLLPAYKEITSKVTKCSYTFFNNEVGYMKLINDIYIDCSRYIRYILDQKNNILTSLHAHEFILPVDPEAIIDTVSVLKCLFHYLETHKIPTFVEKTDRKRKTVPTSSASSSSGKIENIFTIKEQLVIPGIVNHPTYIQVKNLIILLEQIRKSFRIMIHMRYVSLSATQMNIGYSIADIERLLTEFPSQAAFHSQHMPLIQETRQFIQDYVELSRSEEQLGYFANRETAQVHPLLLTQHGGKKKTHGGSPSPMDIDKKKSSSAKPMDIDEVHIKHELIPVHHNRAIHRAKRTRK
jgi:hypothetical protein